MEQQINKISFNHDGGYYACATPTGFSIFSTSSFQSVLRRDLGNIWSVKMLERTNIIAFVGNSDTYPRNKLIIWDDDLQVQSSEISFNSDICDFNIYRQRIIVALMDKTYLYELSTLQLLQTIDTAPNPSGIGEINTTTGVMVTMGGKVGTVRIWKTIDFFKEIEVFQNAVHMIAIDQAGKYLACASVDGTIIPLYNLFPHKNVDQISLHSTFRRGRTNATISSIIFDPFSSWMCVSSSSETIHLFAIDLPSSKQDWYSWGRSFYSSKIVSASSLKFPPLPSSSTIYPPSVCMFISDGDNSSVVAISTSGFAHSFKLDWSSTLVWDKSPDKSLSFYEDNL